MMSNTSSSRATRSISARCARTHGPTPTTGPPAPSGSPSAARKAEDGAVRIVVAIGGNAIIAEHERGTWAEQRLNAATIAHQLAALKRSRHELVLTHGNGPQVG